ncbi:MAG TPA: FtsW/RodA/SpoVE family cell cycle protein [Candidatus Binatia bacterium]|nr:FtsW/RodA/SpoVE family cell cycle protein [Candidatus Binatia bacterium]
MTGPRGRLRPRFRRRELVLLATAALALLVGWLSLDLGRQLANEPGNSALDVAPAGPERLLVYLGALFAAHLVLGLSGRAIDEILLPTAGLLGGIGLLVMERLPQTLAGTLGGLAQTQLVWLLLALAVLTGLAVLVRSDAWLRLYKYTWAAVGIGLLLLTFLFGSETNGARLTLQIGPVGGQPSELLKIVLVVFLAGYLAEYRPLLVGGVWRVGLLRLPPLPYLAPMVALWSIALAIVVVQRDLGTALLYFLTFLLLLYLATGRLAYVGLGLLLFVLGAAVAARIFPHVAARIEIWLDPFADPSGAGYQVVQALYAFGRGGLLGTGLGGGLPSLGERPPIPAIHTDFPLAAIGEELGLVGVLAVLACYLVIVERGLRIAVAAADEFRTLLAAGLALVVAVQAFVIAAGNLKLIPLTGITLPFVSYGGSSLLANGVILGLLLALSDPAVGAPGRARQGEARSGTG